MANRGAPTDYNEWEARGAAGWGWNDVLPYFRKVERDLDFDGPYHGKDGRIAVRRIPQAHWTRHAQAVADACKLAGFNFLPDQNGEFVEGYFPVTHSNEAEQRVSAAMGYLDRDTRKRPNLTISTDTQVKELIFEGTRCVGVKALVEGKEQEFRGREIVLSCGAIHSPAHLLRSGIGPVGHLRELGIPVLVGLEGVGQRLMDHPSISLSSYIRRGARMNEHSRRHVQVGLRYSSGLSGVPKGDMFVAALSKSAWHAVGAQIGSLLTFVNKTYSETGQVKLASRDPRAEPIVEFNLLSDKRDLDRLMSGFRKMAALQMSAPLQGGDRRAVPGVVLRSRAQDRRRQHQEQGDHRDCSGNDGRTGGAAPLHDRHLHRRRLHLRRCHERRRGSWRRSCARPRSACGTRRVRAAWAAPTIRWRWSTRKGASGACRACAWSMPRSSRWCHAPTPISRH